MCMVEDHCDVSGFFSSIGVSLIRHYAVSSAKAKEGKQMVESAMATLTEKVARSLDAPESELILDHNQCESDIEELKTKAASLDEIMHRLAAKVKALKNSRVKWQVLTLSPSNWSNKQASDFFGVLEYSICNARKQAIEKGISSLQDPKKGCGLP